MQVASTVALGIPLALEVDYLVPCAATSMWTCEGSVAWTRCCHMTIFRLTPPPPPGDDIRC